MPERYAARAWVLFWWLVGAGGIFALLAFAAQTDRWGRRASAEPPAEVLVPSVSLDADRWTFCFADAACGNLCLIVFVDMPGIACTHIAGSIACLPAGGQHDADEEVCMQLTRLEERDGVFIMAFEREESDAGNIYYAFIQTIPGLEREELLDGTGWKVVATAENERRLSSLFSDFRERLGNLRNQLSLF